MATQSSATRRLLKDLQEVKENPLFNVVGEPLDGNLFTWHVNIRSAEHDNEEILANPFNQATFHLILEFPLSFPREGPTVQLCTPLPHPNVTLHLSSSSQQKRNRRQNLWNVSLWDCMPAYKGWSSAYSVHSVLVQLQAFLLQEDLLYDIQKVQIRTAVEKAAEFACEGCGHTGTRPFPTFLTPLEIETALRNKQKKLISRPHHNARVHQEITPQPVDAEPEVVPQDMKVLGAWQTVESKKKKKTSIPVKVASKERVQAKPAVPVKTKPSFEESMGQFGLLPQEALTTIMCKLSTKDLKSVSLASRGLKAASEDGYLWKTLLHRHFPCTSLSAASMADWKHVFVLEQSNILESLCCFHSKCTYEEEVIGFPISFTINPRTRDVDYIHAHLDILSHGAYVEGVRCTADNQPFNLLLPLYITPGHFERGLPVIQKTIVKLCPLMRSKSFHPEMVLDVMPKILNTMVVLLCDKGVEASERAIEGYCMLHRLFLALCEKYNLWKTAELAIVKFKESPEARTKSNCPDLGKLMAQLSVCTSDATAWTGVVRPLTGELLDRAVLWVCKHDPLIVENFVKAGLRKPAVVDDELLLTSWEGSKVARRLCMFHVGFLYMLARPSGVSLKAILDGYDALYGMPSAYLKKRMQGFIQKVIMMGYDWPFFFTTMGMQCPTKEYLTGWLGQCWKNSLKKSYHSRQTEFENIQSGGVSKILLKGESYSAPVNMKGVKMLELWRYTTSHVQFLDASCFCFDSDGHEVGFADYCHDHCVGDAVHHSGDVIDHNKREGKHTIDIDLTKVPSNVKEMYFTMSGFAGATLKDFRLPFVQLVDCQSNIELCEYVLEEKPLSTHTAVIMCRMYRGEGPAATMKWQVEAIGHLGSGAADNYGPLRNSIQELIIACKANRI